MPPTTFRSLRPGNHVALKNRAECAQVGGHQNKIGRSSTKFPLSPVNYNKPAPGILNFANPELDFGVISLTGGLGGMVVYRITSGWKLGIRLISHKLNATAAPPIHVAAHLKVDFLGGSFRHLQSFMLALALRLFNLGLCSI